MSSEDPTKNTDDYIPCSHYNCKVRFAKEFHSSSGMPTPPVADSDKYHTILHGLMLTRMFCMKCCQNHTLLICMNSKINIDD